MKNVEIFALQFMPLVFRPIDGVLPEFLKEIAGLAYLVFEPHVALLDGGKYLNIFH